MQRQHAQFGLERMAGSPGLPPRDACGNHDVAKIPAVPATGMRGRRSLSWRRYSWLAHGPRIRDDGDGTVQRARDGATREPSGGRARTPSEMTTRRRGGAHTVP